ncbi:MAG: hypothetical protein A2Y33_12200 [Spirochaetes bacterium GWF1_51_8]|nr:MAG: hypothetical protein A2Y33_12200 [Spirochaetes bacterium GWF1_51_8]
MKKVTLSFAIVLILGSCNFILPPTVGQEYQEFSINGPKYSYVLADDYLIIANIDRDIIKKFGVAEDDTYLYLYYEFGEYRPGKIMTTIGKMNAPNGSITGKYSTGMEGPSRDYGTASNTIEMFFPFVDYYSVDEKIFNNLESGGFYFYLNFYSNKVRFLEYGNINYNYGYTVADDNHIEIQLKKSAIGLSGIALKDLAFVVGKWGTGNNENWGVDWDNFFPAKNMNDMIRYYVTGAGQVVYRGGPAQGYVDMWIHNGGFYYSDAAALARTNSWVTLRDLDNNDASATIEIFIQTNGAGPMSGIKFWVTNYLSVLPYTESAGGFGKNFTIATNRQQVTPDKFLIYPGVQTFVNMVYNDSSTGAARTNSFVAEPAAKLTLWMTGISFMGWLYNGQVSFANTLNGFQNWKWVVQMENGYYSNSMMIPSAEVPYDMTHSGALMKAYWGDRMDNFGADVMFPDCTAFDPNTQGLKIFYDGLSPKIEIYTK